MTARPGQGVTPVAWLQLAALAAIWSGAYFFNRVALDDLPPLTIALGRVGLAAIVLLINVFWRRGVRRYGAVGG